MFNPKPIRNVYFKVIEFLKTLNFQLKIRNVIL